MAVTDVVETSRGSTRVEWGAIFAGATITTALALVLLSFGASLGLGLTSPYPGEGLSPAAFAVAAGLFLIWVHLMSFYIGGYVAARLRARDLAASEHETDVRDGLHGLLVWSVGVIAAGVIALAGVGGIGAAAHAPPDQVTASVANVTDQQVNESAADQQRTDADAQAGTQSQQRVDVLRKLSVISGFITAASLLLGAAAAFFGAHSGGNHRDKSVNWTFFNSSARSP